jgi:hypothetical protein
MEFCGFFWGMAGGDFLAILLGFWRGVARNVRVLDGNFVVKTW